MNEEYNRSILIGSSENVVNRDERSRRNLRVVYTATKGHSHALVKNTSRTVLYGKKAVKINATRYIHLHLFYIILVTFGE